LSERKRRHRARGYGSYFTDRRFVNGGAWYIMTISKLEKAAWQPYLDKVSKTLVGKQAEIEVASVKLGDQFEAEWVPLLGISYDPKNDLIEILLEGLDHLIHKPRDIYVDHDAAGLTSLEVIDSDEEQQILKLRDPLMLPAPAAH
jgi:hypothetical protein